MCADPAFRVLDREASREALKLPAERRLVGQLGAFDASRGHQKVLQAMDQVRAADSRVSLVLSGRHSSAFHAPPAVFGVGYLEDDQMPALVNSLDVACVSLGDNSFGHFSHPAKLCEAMACKIPVVASETAATAWMLHQDRRFLVPLGDSAATADRILANLALDRVNYPDLHEWDEVAARLECLLRPSGSVV